MIKSLQAHCSSSFFSFTNKQSASLKLVAKKYHHLLPCQPHHLHRNHIFSKRAVLVVLTATSLLITLSLQILNKTSKTKELYDRNDSNNNNNDDDLVRFCEHEGPFLRTTWSRKRALEILETVEREIKENVDSLRAKRSDRKERFTILLNTFERRDLLKRSIKHYKECVSVEEIRVVWSERAKKPEEGEAGSEEHFAKKKKRIKNVGKRSFVDSDEKEDGDEEEELVRYDSHETTSIQNRFAMLEDLKTEAVFHVDDDVRIPCRKLASGFEVWKRNRDALVGYFPRAHAKKNADKHSCELRYVWNDFELFFMDSKRYSIALTKAAFSHAKYLGVYEKYLPEGVREYIDKRKNCEDIAMQMLVSSIVNEKNALENRKNKLIKSAVAVSSGWLHYVAGKIDSMFVDGISSGQGHHDERSRCVTDFSRMFGGVRSPLSSSY